MWAQEFVSGCIWDLPPGFLRILIHFMNLYNTAEVEIGNKFFKENDMKYLTKLEIEIALDSLNCNASNKFKTKVV